MLVSYGKHVVQEKENSHIKPLRRPIKVQLIWMMVLKIITYAASIVAQNKKDRVRVLGRGTRSKSKRHSPPTSFLGSSTSMPATCLERRSRTALSNRTQGYVEHFRKNHHRLLLGNWNILTLTGKELELLEEARKYHIDIVGVSSTEKRGRAFDSDQSIIWKHVSQTSC